VRRTRIGAPSFRHPSKFAVAAATPAPAAAPVAAPITVPLVPPPRMRPAIAPATAPPITFCRSFAAGWLRTRVTSADSVAASTA